MMQNALTNAPPDNGAVLTVALMLRGSGVVTYRAAALAAAATLPGAPPDKAARPAACTLAHDD